MTIPAIEISGVSKCFGSGRKKKQALHDITLSITQGEVFGFLGPNGAGKSTTIKLLLHFLRPDSGYLKIMGHTVGREEFRNQIGYISEFPFFYDHLTAKETMLLSGRLSGMTGLALREQIPLLLARMNLTESADQRVSGFSKGMKQRLGMANALVHDPQVLIFDEPMSGLDPLGRHLIKEIIMDLQAQSKTVFFSSHILSDIETLCDRIGIVHQGHLLYAGDLYKFTNGSTSLEDRFVSIIKEHDYASLNR